ncbi:MAG: cobalamin-binding protein [Candidatus Verstraetearchaeota archaeon]|jgi:corrinoid protein of di/trimethylamine methyltransferase|uniref:Cobalamin-binding protein n=1 Tax=Thermoproteota archaeon TaxID=2056631 RepID=A0A523B7L7_9CREN|nr:corrinoid protein [Candidatus Methanomethylicia archaeon]NHV60683.1 cobalamin-binding protein [Candidatus Verstraetearchaeota archaeon]TDA36885.1 MAG: cobalamin-binding protein [Candidatus Verstraetearchaeota archaeon]
MATKEEIINGLKTAIVNGDEEAAAKWAKEAIAAGLDAYELVTKYGGEAMAIVNQKYEKKEYFVPEVLCAANALNVAVDILTPYMKVDKTTVPATVVLGVVEGDIHDIGKNLVKIMLSAAGFNVIDLGKDVPLQKFLEKAKEVKADVVGMSALMSTTMPGMKKVISMFQEAGVRNKVKVIVGGGPVTEEWALSIGADARPHDASAAVGVVKQLVEKLRSERGESW